MIPFLICQLLLGSVRIDKQSAHLLFLTCLISSEIPEHTPFHHIVESADGHGETSASKDGSEPRSGSFVCMFCVNLCSQKTAAASSEDDMSSSHSSFSRHTSDGNLGSNLSGIPSGQWPPSSGLVFGEQDQNQFSNNLCLEGAYTYGRRSISENYPKDTNSNGENYLTSEGHTIPRNSTSVTQQGGWTGMLSHEAHHSSRLFGQTQFVDSGIDLNNMVGIRSGLCSRDAHGVDDHV